MFSDTHLLYTLTCVRVLCLSHSHTESADAQDQRSSSLADINPVGTPSAPTAVPADACRQMQPLSTEGTERDTVSHPEGSQQSGAKDGDQGLGEESFTAMDDMLLLDSGGAYQSDEEEGQEMPANPTSLTATNVDLSKVLPDKFVQSDKPSVLIASPYTQVATAGSAPSSIHPLPSAPMQPNLMSPTVLSPQGSYRPNLPPAPVQQTSHHLPPSYAQVHVYTYCLWGRGLSTAGNMALFTI